MPKFLFLLPNKHSGIPENTAELSLKNGKGFPHYITKDYVEKLSNYFNEAIIPEKIYGYSYAIDRFSKKKTTWHNGKYASSYYAGAATHKDVFLKAKRIIELF